MSAVLNFQPLKQIFGVDISLTGAQPRHVTYINAASVCVSTVRARDQIGIPIYHGFKSDVGFAMNFCIIICTKYAFYFATMTCK